MSSDAGRYGVRIESPIGDVEWKAVEVRHLLPEENRGRHHVFVDAVDANGDRVQDGLLTWGWYGGDQMDAIKMDKPAGEPMCNIPIFRGQMVWVAMPGRKSDRVLGMHTSHGDELGPGGEIWSSEGHHSFYVKFQRVGQAAGKVCLCCGKPL